MTFTEAALEILKREGKPLHFKELTERAMTKKLLTFVGRTPEVTMQTQLTAAVKKAPGNPFVRVKPGVFGLLRYPEMPPEEKERDSEPAARPAGAKDEKKEDKRDEKKDDKRRPERRASEAGDEERGRRRRRRGGRGRGGAAEAGETREGAGAAADEQQPAPGHAREGVDHPPEDAEEPSAGGLSAEARAAALAETGVLEGDDEMSARDDDSDDGDDDTDPDAEAEGGGARGLDEGKEGGSERGTSSRGGLTADSGKASAGGTGDADGDGDADADGDEDGAFGAAEPADGAKGPDGDDPARRRRRRRRRRRGGAGEGDFGGEGSDAPRPDRPSAEASGGGGQAGPAVSEGGMDSQASSNAEGSTTSTESAGGPGQPARRIMTPVDAAIEILRGQPPGRGVHVRQIADSAIRRRLIHGEPNEAWRVIRTSLAAEPKDRLRNGLRPRVRAAGSGLYALARRTPDSELEKAEQVFGEARRALRERTIAALEKRITELPPGAFEALARVLLQREGLGPTTFVKRVEGTIYVEALRGRGSRPSKCLIALRSGSSAAGRRAIGELRAGIRARGQDEGLLMLAGRLAEDAISEWKQAGSPLEIADGAAMAETCARHGVGVLPAVLNVDFVDADFFAELAEG